jgi:hypothetical protein
MTCLLGEGRSVLHSPLGAVGNPLVESPAMVRDVRGGPPWAGPMMMTPEPSPRGRGSSRQSGGR